MNKFLGITGYTILDQLRNKSFYVLLGIAVLLVLLLRSCSGGSYTINGRTVEGGMVAWQASKIAFQVIATGMFLMTALLAMRIFSRDQEDGSTVLFLSRPVRRWQYALGRVTGVWLLSVAFMLTIHSVVFFTAWSKTGGMTPAFLTASLVCFINPLFVVLCVCLFSLYMPDFIAALFTMGIVAAGFVSDGGYQLMRNPLVQSALPSGASPEPALWRVVYPKLFMVQSYAGSIISNGEFFGMGPVHPVINVAAYCCLLALLLLVGFRRREIS